jgi:hypothetical protein
LRVGELSSYRVWSIAGLYRFSHQPNKRPYIGTIGLELELELCDRILFLVLCTALLLCSHAIGGALPLRCDAKLPC